MALFFPLVSLKSIYVRGKLLLGGEEKKDQIDKLNVTKMFEHHGQYFLFGFLQIKALF